MIPSADRDCSFDQLLLKYYSCSSSSKYDKKNEEDEEENYEHKACGYFLMMTMMMRMMTMLITHSVIPDDCHIFFQRAAIPSSPVSCNLEDFFDCDNLSLTQIKVWIRMSMSYSEYEDVVKMGIIFFFTSRHCSSPKDRDSYVTLGSPGSQSL